MARVDVIKMFKETPAFIFKNVDILVLYILAVIPALITSSPLSANLKELPQHVYFALWALLGVYGAFMWLTIITAILGRLKNKKVSPLGALEHVWKQLFRRGAWWYLIFYLLIYYGPALLQAAIIDQSIGVKFAVRLIHSLVSIAAVYYTYIIVDDYRSFKDTAKKSLLYVRRSLIPFLKIILFTLLLVIPISALLYLLGTQIGFPLPTSAETLQGSAAMLPFYVTGFLVGYVYSIVYSKLYLQIKTND